MARKTHNAWLDFLDKLAHCSAPTLAWTDLTQSKLSKVKLGGTTYANNNGLTNAFLYPGKDRIFISTHRIRISI